nr:MATE family efflux transporter [uncultured Blautia sp.]
MSTSSSATLMTKGPIWKKIIAFAIPLFLGNLFQQFYNTADSLIVGNFLGSSALAAVSSSGNLIFLMVGFFNGLAVGAGVVVARYFGAKKFDLVQRAIHTIITLGFFCGIALTFVGVIAAPQILVLMGTPPEVLPNSVTYFRIYFCGSLAFVMYNFLVGILQAVGDSRHPLMYLIISSVTNIILDLILVAGFHFGVGAAALATVISQCLSALLCFLHLLRGPKEYRIYLSKLRLDSLLLKQIISNGLPAGLQNSIISLANVVVQSNINKFGQMAVAGCGSYSKIEGFAFLPITCFALALTTFISQNLGAKEYDRAKKGAVFGVICSVVTAELVGIVIYTFAPYLIAAFNNTPEVLSYGVAQAHTASLFYFLLAFSHCMAGILRGAGKSTVPMFVMLICWCIIRVTYITVTVHFIPDIRVIFWAYPITWTLSSIVFLLYFLKSDWIHGLEKQER